VGTIPAIFAGASTALNIGGIGLAMPAWAIGLGFASSAVALGSLWYVSARHIRSIVALPGACHVRITTSSALIVLPQTTATVPIPFFRHKHTKSANTIVAVVAPPGTPRDSVRSIFLPLDEASTVPDKDILNELLNGRAPLSVPGPKADPATAYWAVAKAENGKEYWWNEVTRQRQWPNPIAPNAEEQSRN
jgi:hypothetical protein